MPLTTQQQADFDIWKQNQSQPLPASLKNILTNSFFTEYQKNWDVKVCFSKQWDKTICGAEEIWRKIENNKFSKLEIKEWFLILLSRTPDGQAVMPFLDVETREYKNLKNKKYKEAIFKGGFFLAIDKCDNYILGTATLDHLLYREFTEALRTGKTFDEALEIITKIYLINFYA